MSTANLSAPERDAVGAMWAFRARAERETAAHYEQLAQRLADSGVAADFVARVRSASKDEQRHQQLCAELAARFGHTVDDAGASLLRRIAPHDLQGRPRLAYEIVAFFCVTEAINATLLLRSFKQALDPRTRDVLRSLLADEVEHSRIGWAYVASEPGSLQDIAERMPAMLDATTHDEQFLNDPAPALASPACAAHGLLSQAELRAVFHEAMDGVVFPGLDHCGMDTGPGRRWFRNLTDRWQS